MNNEIGSTELPVRTIRITLGSNDVVAKTDGWFEGHIKIEIPKHMHINGPNPGLKWLVPLRVEFTGLNGTADFPLAADFGYEGEIEIPFSVQMTGNADVEECEISIRYQACTDTECLMEETLRLALLVRAPHARP